MAGLIPAWLGHLAALGMMLALHILSYHPVAVGGIFSNTKLPLVRFHGGQGRESVKEMLLVISYYVDEFRVFT